MISDRLPHQVGCLPSGTKVVVLEEVATPERIRALVALETNVGAPLGWVTTCREGSRFVKLLSATKACKGFFTSGHVGGDGFAVTYSTSDLQERYNSVAVTITMLQQGADELRQREEVLRLTGKTMPLYMDRMATWSFQSGSSCGHG